MPDEGTTQRLFDKIEDIRKEIHDVRVDVAVMKDNQKTMKEDIKSLEAGHSTQQSVIDKGKGIGSSVKWFIGTAAILAAGGIGWLLSVLFNGH